MARVSTVSIKQLISYDTREEDIKSILSKVRASHPSFEVYVKSDHSSSRFEGPFMRSLRIELMIVGCQHNKYLKIGSYKL